MDEKLIIEVRDSLDAVRADDWNALDNTGNPFLRYEFLHTLEATGCLGEASGWFPHYFLLRRCATGATATGPKAQDISATQHTKRHGSVSDHDEVAGQLIAAVPAFVKVHSFGEFVFDWAWASAYERHGLHYYPKLVAAIPFTPATGPRLLVRDDQVFATAASLLIRALQQFADRAAYSSVHWLFLTEKDHALLCQHRENHGRATAETSRAPIPHLARIDCQYHWHNRDYRDFDSYLAECTARRRKTIRRERRHVTEAGLRLERRAGTTLTRREWQTVHRLYASTYDRKWGSPSLSLDFFERLGAVFGEQVLIVLAYDPADRRPTEPVACSIMIHGGGTLYGRYWGCRRQYHSLHFECCYYQGIEFCIERGIKHFEPGAQGEHKITRGFEPTLTRSAHYIAHPQFREAIQHFLDDERVYVEQRCAGLADLLPFRHDKLSV